MKKALLWGAALCAVLVFAGCPTDDNDNNGNNTPQPFTLTVTGMPAGKLIGASLMAPLDLNAPVATGMDLQGTGTFTFYYPGADMMPTSKPFNEAGEYIVQLAEIELTAGTGIQIIAVHAYMGSPAGQQFVPIAFPCQASIPWNHFVDIGYQP